MLLTILLISDDSALYANESLKQLILSSLLAQPAWDNAYEVKTISLSQEELVDATGQFPDLNSLIANKGYLKQCKGEYIWILPSFITFKSIEIVFSSILDALSLKVSAVALNPISKKVELEKTALSLLPSAHHFDDFRYILPRGDMEACYANSSDYTTILTYLSLQESAGSRAIYAKVPCDAIPVKGLASNSYFNLSMAYFSGTRPWQREVLDLPKSLIYRMRSHDKGKVLTQGYIDSLRHFLFSSCSALEHFSAAMFSENTNRASKEKAFALSHQVLLNISALCEITPSSSSLLLRVTELLCFLSRWQVNAGDSIASNNVNPIKPQKSPLSGIWWLGRELKDELNRLGRDKIQLLINDLRRDIEGVALTLQH